MVSNNNTTVDFIATDSDVDRLHYAFLITETEFDEIFDRKRERQLTYWSDPVHNHPGDINSWDDGRGVYVDAPTATGLRSSPVWGARNCARRC